MILSEVADVRQNASMVVVASGLPVCESARTSVFGARWPAEVWPTPFPHMQFMCEQHLLTILLYDSG